MQVKIRGAVKVRSAAVAQQALEAFDHHAHGEFYTSEIWEHAGRFLICAVEFEIAADCDPKDAINALVAHTTDGAVQWQMDDDSECWQSLRSKNTKTVLGTSLDAAKFGQAIDELLTSWKTPLDKARAMAAKKAAKAQKKAKTKSIVVDLEGPVSHVVALLAGGFAASVRNEVVFFGSDGAIASRQSVGLPNDDNYTFRAHRLTELLDGRIAVTGGYSALVRVVDRATGEVAQFDFGDEAHVQQLIAVPNGFVRPYNPLAMVLDDVIVKLDLGTTDEESPSHAARWGDRFIVACGQKTLVYEGSSGKLLFETQAGTPTFIGKHLYTNWESEYGRTAPDGTFTTTSIPCSGRLLGIGEDFFQATGSAKRLDRNETQVWFAANIYGRANSGPPIALTDSRVVMTPPKYPPSARLVVIDFETGKATGEVTGKGEIEDTFRVDEQTIVGLAFGAQGKKLHVFRNLQTEPSYEALGGHKKAIRGVAILGSVVATWSDDGTTRLFPLG